MQALINDRDYKKVKLEDCVVAYKDTRNELLLEIILRRMRGIMKKIVYSRVVNYYDMDLLIELCEDVLLECIENYDPTYKVLFSTYYYKCATNALNTAYKKVKYYNYISLDKLHDSDDENSNSLLDTLADENDTSFDDIHCSLMLERIKDLLTDNEYKVCKVIIETPVEINPSEIAERLNLTTQGVYYILKRLRKKINVFLNNF